MSAITGSVPLLTPPTVPVNPALTQLFGKDELTTSELFGRVARWDRDTNAGSLKTWAVFFAKMAFSFFDAVGLGGYFFGQGGCSKNLEQSRTYQYNRECRERIVNAVGGEAACGKIPVVAYNPNPTELKLRIDLDDSYFPKGAWAVQAEDPAGRKILALRIKRDNTILYNTIHQSNRETDRNGWEWRWNVYSGKSLGEEREVFPTASVLAAIIEKICNGTFPNAQKAPKP